MTSLARKEERTFLLRRGWCFTGKRPEMWRSPDPPHEYFVIADALALEEGREPVLRDAEKVLDESAILEIFNEGGLPVLQSRTGRSFA